MLKNIMTVIMVICLLAMLFAIIVFYEMQAGRLLVCVSAIIAVIAYSISDYLERKEEQES